MNIYKDVYVIPGTILISVILYKIWSKDLDLTFLAKSKTSSNQNESSNYNLLNNTAYFLAGLLLLLVIVPVLYWPMSTLVRSLNWDAGLYHFPRAVEIWRSGSVWDFSVPYADYPYGYEILLGFNLMLSKNTNLFSITHAMIVLLFILSAWILSMRYSKIPKGLSLFAILILILSGFSSVTNPWFGLRGPVYTIGKNDLFLAAVTLAAIIFVPVGPKYKTRTDWIGLGISSGLSISIKPNSGLILIFLWIYALYSAHPDQRKIKNILPGMILATLGMSWILRNIIGFGQLFDPNSYRIVQWSIWSNLLNPDFNLHVPGEFLFSIIIILAAGVFTLTKREQFYFGDLVLFLIILLSFLLSPASTSRVNPAVIAWRFGLILLIMQFVYLIRMLEPISMPVIFWMIKKKGATVFFSTILIAITLVFYFYLYDILRLVPQKAEILERPYTVENAPYPSVFDFANENIRDSVIRVEGSLKFFAYDDDFTNTLSQKEEADYVILVDRLPENFWVDLTDWELLYQDGRGFVFQNPAISESDQ
jgi:hypothetical protein